MNTGWDRDKEEGNGWGREEGLQAISQEEIDYENEACQ